MRWSTKCRPLSINLMLEASTHYNHKITYHQRYQQFNVDVQGALNQILGTVTLALKSFDRYVQVLGEKQGPEIVVVGSGQQNMNRVTINGKQSPNTL
ncbi:jg22487 [Pararge aegeria aegeria]|uniref:Jg22487 protein n=1 Tax=Pararge aegeria aegeria TaxID=348720 RepID=A0A8S4QS23_9NEOP|nr:jg22487 [Pararge aegeria aegeria]